MKSFRSIIVLATLSGLQLLSGSQAQAPFWGGPAVNAAAIPTTASSSVSSTVPTSTGSAAVPTPTVPAFVNTPGLSVSTPYDGMQATQNAYLSISFSLTSGQTIGSAVITVAKADGSNNNTIVDFTYNNATLSPLSLSPTWNVNSTVYPVGNYVMNLVVTPFTATSAPAPTGTSSAVAAPASTSAPGTGASIYYWKGSIVVKASQTPAPTTNANSASTMAVGCTWMAAVAGSAVLLGSVLLL